MTHQAMNEQFRDLIRRAQSGDMEARNKLVKDNLPLVASIVRRFMHRGFDYDDLYQVGSLGLLKAILRFDLSYDVQFSTYAVPKIIGELKRYIRESSVIRISRSIRELASHVIAAKDELNQKLGRTPSISELADHLGLEREQIVAALDAVAPVHSLQEVIGEGDRDDIPLESILGTSPDHQSLMLKEALKCNSKCNS
jgi:RNA polymerase sporulation-specific sigma factor